MSTWQGVGVSPGQVVGPVRSMPPAITPPAADAKLSGDPEAVVAELKDAAQAVSAQLKERAGNASGDAKEVLEATALMAVDPMLMKSAVKKVRAGQAPERAWWDAAEGVEAMLAGLGGMMAERVRDVQDVRDRVVARLRGIEPPGIPVQEEPFILVAHDLAPADTATLDPALVIALVTAEGGPQSHTAIIARSLGLPAVVAATGVLDAEEQELAFVDGSAGIVTQPAEQVHHEAAVRWKESQERLGRFDGKGVMACGHEVPLLANVGNGQETLTAVEAGAEGVGLFRTEFLFLGRDAEPAVDEQTTAYREVFEAFSDSGAKVVVRTLDAGADKPLPFLTDADEPNPALGVRGYRTHRTAPEVLERQLTAIARAAEGTNADVWVMAPMISTAAEAAEFRALCTAAGLRVAGVMVEVPSAALSAEELSREIDFVSIGTNDLTQYTMASDRQLGSLAELNDTWQPAVLRLIRSTTAPGRVPVGVCGEAAADPALAVVLVGLGVSTLSMSARSLPAVAAVLRTVTLDRAREIAAEVVASANPDEGRRIVRAAVPELDRLGL